MIGLIYIKALKIKFNYGFNISDKEKKDIMNNVERSKMME